MKPNRKTLATSFIQQNGWGNAKRLPLAGDASNRRYERLVDPASGNTIILMDAPPENGETTKPFLKVAEHLNYLGFCPPEIYAADQNNGFILLEDLGDDLFSRLTKTSPKMEYKVYEAAVDFLIELHRYPPPEFCKTYDAPTMADMAGLVFDFYAPETSQKTKQESSHLLAESLQTHHPFIPVLALRDFHSENLIWLPDRTGSKRVGLLDFQDAIICHPAYDLISLTKDARRDVSPDLAEHLLLRYIEKTGQEPNSFRAAAAAIAVQRNLRILGIFARLALKNGKPAYIGLIPRIWNHLQRDLTHPALKTLRQNLSEILPEPTPEFLQNLREKCQNIQIQS